MSVLNVPNVTRLAGYAQLAVGVATIIAVIYLIRKLKQGSDAVAKPFAELYLDLTHDTVEPLGAVKLPEGDYITFADIVAEGSKLDSRNQFVWRGQTYEVTRTATGYEAMRI